MANKLAKAIEIAAQAFQNKIDNGGRPYILHCLWVMNELHSTDDDLNIIGVLHDLMEDCSEWDTYKLAEAGFSHRVITALTLLTHKKEPTICSI